MTTEDNELAWALRGLTANTDRVVAVVREQGWRPPAPPRIGHAGGPQYWCPKNLREHLCVQQHFAPDDHTRSEIQRLINLLDVHRPLGSNGKHGERLHTPTCGCEDR
ncbi:hypothetical protein [Nocardia sp. MW-W600-9]